MIWLKKFGQLPQISTSLFGPGFALSRAPKPGEKMSIHPHARGGSLPSPRDLKSLVEKRQKTKGVSSLIAVTQKGKLVGYTFLTIRDLKKAKPVLKMSDSKTLTLKKIKELGVNIRFVPLKGFKFNPRTKKFSRKKKPAT